MSTIDVSTCVEETSHGEWLEPCGRVACAAKRDDVGWYPVCAYHARGRMVPLTELLATKEAP